jgi:hypothetical protein
MSKQHVKETPLTPQQEADIKAAFIRVDADKSGMYVGVVTLT